MMSSFHAAYSVGGLAGAGTGALAAAGGVGVGWHLAVALAGVLTDPSTAPSPDSQPRRRSTAVRSGAPRTGRETLIP
ncbi:MAG: hypothetical protein M3137_05755 [Actinomycetota bacterium]|nr:hypothetical protein [Actinomycetota bacterium]